MSILRERDYKECQVYFSILKSIESKHILKGERRSNIQLWLKIFLMGHKIEWHYLKFPNISP